MAEKLKIYYMSQESVPRRLPRDKYMHWCKLILCCGSGKNDWSTMKLATTIEHMHPSLKIMIDLKKQVKYWTYVIMHPCRSVKLTKFTFLQEKVLELLRNLQTGFNHLISTFVPSSYKEVSMAIHTYYWSQGVLTLRPPPPPPPP